MSKLNKGLKNTVASVASQYLCNSCGACATACPVDAISYRESIGGYLFPQIDRDKCIECGMCLEVCPGIHFGKALSATYPPDPFIGPLRECLVGRATDDDIYRSSQSGGVVTALLLHALRQGIIQGAIVITSIASQPPRFEPIIATTEQQIKSAQRSKYVPIPVLKTLKKVEQQELTVAFVGLPCHIHGLYNLFDIKPKLKKLVPLKIGLICDRTMTLASVDYLVRRSGLTQEPCDLYFRDKQESGWPGCVKISSVSGRAVVFPDTVRKNIKDYFTPARCRLCFDKLNVFADLTVGDPWGIASADKVNGESIVTVRTSDGEELLKGAIDHGAILARPVQCHEVVKGQRIDQRRRDWKEYCKAWRSFGYELPNYYEKVTKYIPESTYRGNRYIRQLKHSLSLDKFRSREELLRYVEHRLFVKALNRWFFFPIRVMRGLFRRIRRRVRTSASLIRGGKNDS